MSKIDSTGVFIGTIVESGLGLTKKGFPQAIFRLAAKQKYIEQPADLAHFKLEAPAYVDWSAYNEDTLAYLVLFNSADQFIPEGPDKTSLMNYEQVQLATGWDGAEFDSFSNGSLVGKSVLFRIEEDTYNNVTSLKVNWIDAADAPPERQLKTLDASEIKTLNSKLVIQKTSKPAVVAKPAPAVPSKPGPVAAVPTPAVVATSAPAATSPQPTATPVTSAATPAAATPPAPKTKAKKAPPTPAPVAEAPAAPPASAGCTKMDAWEAVNKGKGDNEDQVLEEAWMSALAEVAGTRDEEALSTAEWGKVRDIVLKDLAA